MSDNDAQQLMEGVDVKNNQVTFGMANKGNTCFFNSVMQSFMHTIPLQQYAYSGHYQNFNQGKGQCILGVYIDFIKKTTREKRAPVDMMIKFIQKCMPRYKFGRQEDAQEFITGLLDQLIKACFDHKEPVYKFVIKHQEETPIFKIFGFTARSQILCESCGYQSNTYSQKCDLNLHLPKKKGVTFQDCLNDFVNVERLSGDNKYQCDKCNKKVNAQRSQSIETPPRILMVNFVRSLFGKKNKEIIPYPIKFNLKNYMSSAIDAKSGAAKNNVTDDLIYDLYALIVHEGQSTNSGHYYCYTRSLDTEKWYNCNDSCITKLNSIDNVLKKQAYILFYQLKTKQQVKEETIEKHMILDAVKSVNLLKAEEVEKIKQSLPIISPIPPLSTETSKVSEKKEEEENGPEDISRKRMKIKVKPVAVNNFQFIPMKKRLHPLSSDGSTVMRKTALLQMLSKTRKYKHLKKLHELPVMLKKSSVLVPAPNIPPLIKEQQKMKKI